MGWAFGENFPAPHRTLSPVGGEENLDLRAISTLGSNFVFVDTLSRFGGEEGSEPGGVFG